MGTLTDLQTRIEELELENAQLRAYKAECDKAEPVGEVIKIGGYPDESVNSVIWYVAYKCLNEGSKLYTHPIPSDRARITEQDAREIIDSHRARNYLPKMSDSVFEGWLCTGGRALLDKLNADREPAVSVPDEVRNILERISRWHGEFPLTGKFWDDDKTRPISYGAENGSNGERDYMRGLAYQALAMLSALPAPTFKTSDSNDHRCQRCGNSLIAHAEQRYCPPQKNASPADSEGE